ncbi:MAG: DNA mismatch repair endonuclease MutL [Paludibacteraceae bacterium]|nr:DNA mismatch repair endonuclease MutL [Paludibacteraceae bacterium]
MSDIIHLLPDSVANQIAAGEVIQRPASVIKELVENSIDAGATYIQVVIKDAGRTLIQIIDNGKGMSETDARMAFERHATSKIKSADDLFSLHTMGFRGEALASICAIAQVELRTRREEDELGTFIEMAGSKVEQQKPISCSKGTIFSVKNLFFNIPARRKFLKSNATELNHILTEFNRIAIIYPDIAFSLTHNDEEIYQLPESTLKQRIINILGKGLSNHLLNIYTETSLLTISGFVGKPESARKQMHNQYFFVNGRYMRHPYFHKAVMKAFDNMLAPETSPNYFICFNIDPANIDVNIHPTKTEIKFENEQAIWSILLSAVKESLGKFSVVPDIDFDTDGSMDIPILNSATKIHAPQVDFNPDYNPFKQEYASPSTGGNYNKREQFDWEKLYEGFENEKTPEPIQAEITLDSHISDAADTKHEETASLHQPGVEYFQFKGKYILTSVKSGLMFIDQHRAHMRILFEQYLQFITQRKGLSQQILFPELIDLSAEDSLIMEELKEDLAFVGFDIDKFGKNTYRVNGVPANMDGMSCLPVLEEMISAQKESTLSGKNIIQERIALTVSKAAAIPYGKVLSAQEISNMVDSLFSCKNHNYAPDGKPIINILSEEEIEHRL